ncbi:MAG: hypothetical protein SGARI_007510, partial [Bacillariaceae sp.]
SEIAAETLPDNILHVTKRNLDVDDEYDTGGKEFKEVIQIALDEWNKTKGDANTPPDLVFYFTLGAHKGPKCFWRNIQGAWHFALALDRFADESFAHHQDSIKVVITGTDATLPSDTPDAVVKTANEATWTIPTYKIMEYNYTYAVSKICQYYIIAINLGLMQGIIDEEQKEEWNALITKMEQHVMKAGDDGNYHPPNYTDEGGDDRFTKIAMEELNDISRKVSSSLLSKLAGNFSIAQGISICYTPLHARAWAEQAIKAASTIEDASDRYYAQKAYVLEQIVKRFKNAISVQQAV